MKEKKDNKRRAEAFLKQEMDKPEKIQDHHLTGTDQPFLPFMEQWLNEVERYVPQRDFNIPGISERRAAGIGPKSAACLTFSSTGCVTA